MEGEKKQGRKQQLTSLPEKPEIIKQTTTIESETGVMDDEFIDTVKLRKLAYLTVIEDYLWDELSKEGTDIIRSPAKKPVKRKKKQTQQVRDPK